MIDGPSPKRLVFRDGVSQSQRLVNAPNPDSINIEDRTLKDFLDFAAVFAKYLNFYSEDNKISGDWQGFLNGGLSDPADQQKWMDGLISYVEAPDAANLIQRGTPYTSPHLALFVTFLKLLDKIKLQLNDFTAKHLDLYYKELLSVDKKQSVPDVVNIVAKLATDVEQLLLPRGTQLSAGKDSEGKELIYQTTKDTLISRAEVKNIKSLFVDKRVIGLDEKRKSFVGHPKEGIQKIMDLALGYQNFDPKNTSIHPSNARKYLLEDAELAFIAKSAQITDDKIDWARIYHILESGYRRQQLQTLVLASGVTHTLFSLLLLTLADKEGHLPDYNDNYVDEKLLDQIYNNAIGNTADKTVAAAYITGKLMFSVKDFNALVLTLNQTSYAELRWHAIYILLEAARSKRKDLPQPVPFETEWKDIIAVNDAKAGADEETGHFKTFGKTGDTTNHPTEPVPLGMAISSSKLLMSEGVRNIEVYIAFDPFDARKTEKLTEAINEMASLPAPFLYYVSTSDGWKPVTAKTLAFGNFLRPITGKTAFEVTLADEKLISTTDIFSATDKNSYVILRDGSVYLIQEIIDAKSVRGLLKARMAAQASAQKYNRNELLLNALHVQFVLDESYPEIVPPNGGDETVSLVHSVPVLAFLLNKAPHQDGGTNGFNIWYQKFHDLTIANVAIDVMVTGIKTLTIENQYGSVDAKKPFAPFGNEPAVGSSLLFSNPEIASKAIQELTLTFDWMNMPKSLAEYYAGYRVVSDNDSGGLNPKIENNETFTAGFTMVENRLPINQDDAIKLFNKDNAGARQNQTTGIKWSAAGARDLTGQEFNTNDLTEWKRYFVLELKNHFKNIIYPVLIAQQAMSDKPNVKQAILNPPLVPMLKQLSVGYKASATINTANGEDNTGNIFHITPLGYAQIADKRFLPALENEGELYIGLTNLDKQQNLSLLVQMAVGSANPDLQTPTVSWSYLNQNRWINFTQHELLSDTTNGLLQSGLNEFFIPAGLNNNNTLVGDNLYWLRASVGSNSAAIPNLVDILAQGAEAIFVNHGNAADHLAQPLEKDSIKSAVDNLPGIKNITQPFESTGGKPIEANAWLYTRVSERLRHKNRALTMWDYERIVLEEFPELYKVKCLPSNFSGTMQDTGGVDVIVIPRIQGWFSFNSFQPKLPADALLRVRDYLEAHISPFVTVTVKNPTYMQLRVRTAVRIKQGYPEAYYLEKLEEELKRFLAPWAYDKQAEIVIGGTVHHNVIVNFIAQRPYIDHVNTIKLFQSRDGNMFRNVLDNDDANEASIVDPNVVLVSAPSHEIRLLTEDDLADLMTEGVSAMAINVDFKIAQNDIVTP